MTPELRELIRALQIHPDVFEATILTRDGETLSVKHPMAGGERICYRTENI